MLGVNFLFLNTLLFLFPTKMLVIMAGIEDDSDLGKAFLQGN